jgi:RNA polymerase sigma factor for flagellar operon FliA
MSPSGDECDLLAASDEEGPESLLEQRRKLDGFAATRKRLPVRLRRVIDLYYDRDVPQREIARRMGVTEARVSQLRQIALTTLRQLAHANLPA